MERSDEGGGEECKRGARREGGGVGEEASERGREVLRRVDQEASAVVREVRQYTVLYRSGTDDLQFVAAEAGRNGATSFLSLSKSSVVGVGVMLSNLDIRPIKLELTSSSTNRGSESAKTKTPRISSMVVCAGEGLVGRAQERQSCLPSLREK